MFWPVFAFGSVWLIAGLILVSLLLIAFVEAENADATLITVIIAAGLMTAFGDKRFVPWIIHHPLTILEGALAYFVMGVLWGIMKWFFHVLKARDRYEAFRKDWVSTNGPVDDTPWPQPIRMTTPTNTKRKVFQEAARSQHVLPPLAKDHKGQIVFWMSYWPFSAVWTIIHDPVTRLYRLVYRRLVALFDGISSSMFKKYKEDFDS